MRRIGFSAAAACILVLGHAMAAEQSFAPNDGVVAFEMPSGNVACQYVPQGGAAGYVPKDGGPELGCDRLAPSFRRFVLGKSGKARSFQNSGDTACCEGFHVLKYGDSWRKGPFTCQSAAQGLTCSRGDGHGFFISKAKSKVY